MAGRRLGTFVTLPDRATPAERIATLDADVRAAADEAKAKLLAHAQRYVVTGWAVDDDSWEMVMLPEYRLGVTVRIARHD